MDAMTINEMAQGFKPVDLLSSGFTGSGSGPGPGSGPGVGPGSGLTRLTIEDPLYALLLT